MRDRVRAALFDAEPTPPRFGRYLVKGTLGRGGLGVVYVAHDPELDRDVAIKRVGSGPAGSDKLGDRLRREAQALARLSHPNVVAVHDVGVDQGQVFLAMELIDGRTLAEWSREQPRSWQEIREVLVAAARGLAAAHRVDLVHRDVKPANILVDRQGVARVLDFGLARAVVDDRTPSSKPGSWIDADLTEGDALVGTPAYMAPEQFLRGTVDARTDQWGLCVTAYELLYGVRPFAGADLDALRSEVLAAVVRRPKPHRGVPTWLHAVIARGLAADPADRWPDMAALERALSRDARRSRRRWLAAAAALAAIGGGSAVWIHDGDQRAPSSTCEPRVRVSALQAQWSTPNAIRWSWTVDAGDVDTLQQYRLVLEPISRQYGLDDNPELGFFQLPGTAGRDLVDGTITDGLEPQTQYSARLIAEDNLGCRSESNLATERTPPTPRRSVALFTEQPRASLYPDALVVARDPARAFEGEYYLEYSSADDPECTDRESLCFQNLRLVDLEITARLGEAYNKNAYLEFALSAQTPATPYWANIMLLDGGQWRSFDAWSVRPQSEYRRIQVPLRALAGRTAATAPAAQSRLGGFGIGGAWGFGATIRIDSVRILY
jgi:hypothetical protein